MKVNTKCNNSPLEPPFGDLGVTHRVHLWLDGKRIVDFLVVIIQLFSLALTAEALLSENFRNRKFSEGVGHFECKFEVDRDDARNP